MPKQRLLTWLGLTTLAIFLAVGFFEVMERRFAEGDVYPHYASYRNDPLGTSAFYESLERMDGYRVQRNITHLNSVKGLDEDTTLLLLGYPRDGFQNLRAPEDSPVIAAVEEGARLVITTNPGLVPEKFLPVKSEEEDDWFERRKKLKEKQQEKTKGVKSKGEKKEQRAKRRKGEDVNTEQEKKEQGDGDDAKEESEEQDDEEDEEEKLEREMEETIGPRLTKKFGFEMESLESFERPDGGWEVESGEKSREGVARMELPTWYSQFRFTELDDAWKVVAQVDDKPVVIERKVGNGSIVLTTDSFFVSNEALHLEATPEFLLWVLGGKRNIIFDETVHGSEETGGAMKLMRRYRVHGVFFGLFIFVILWAWRSASSLAPGSEELDRGLVGASGTVAGEETGSGLIRLLQRSISKNELLSRSIAIWKESQVREIPAEVEKGISEVVQKHEKDARNFGIVWAYNEIASLLRRR